MVLSGEKHRGDIHLSKTISWILRHGAVSSGLVLQEGGFLYVEELLNLPQIKNNQYDIQDVRRMVANNDKKRFYMEPHPTSGKLRIRANQGHSIPVTNLELKPITTPTDYPDGVVHGTYETNWIRIKEEGLKPMNRTHIHFTPWYSDHPERSTSAMREDCDLIIFINLRQALQDGIPFFLSTNNVILSPGNDQGCIPYMYFEKTYDRNTGWYTHILEVPNLIYYKGRYIQV